MDLRRLRYFLVVAEELHFARAAARLGIEQSPLSRQIQELETKLNVRLFERTRRSTRLTKAGERFVIDGRRILADVEVSVRALRSFAAANQPMRLGLAEGLASAAFGRLLHLCRATEPSLSVTLVERPLVELIELMVGGGLDAVLSPQTIEGAELQSHPVWSEPLMLAVPSVAMSKGGAVSLKAHSAGPWILPDPVQLPGYAAQVRGLLQAKSIAVQSHVMAATPATLVRLVAAGAGVGLLPQALATAPSDVSLQRLKDPDAVLTTWLSTRRGDASETLQTFRQLVGAAAVEPQTGG